MSRARQLIENDEAIKAAAVRSHDGRIFTAKAHWGACVQANQAGAQYTDEDLGFVTTTGRFVDRSEAELIGLRNGQLRPEIQDPSMVHAADFSHFVEGLDDELGGVDPKDYADQTINEPPEYTEALEDVLDDFNKEVRADVIKLLRDGIHKVLAKDRGWQKRFPPGMFPKGYGRLIARAALARRAEKSAKNYLTDPTVKSMRRIVDDWLRYS